MKKFCPICNKKYSFCKSDHDFFASRNDECLQCYVVIAKDRYRLNINGGNTLFSPLGFGLGDKIVADAVLSHYKRKNPCENVFISSDWDHFNVQRQHFNFNKVFWSDTTSSMEIPKGVIWFSLVNEFQYLGKYLNIFPRYHIAAIPEKPSLPVPENFIALHLRNLPDNTLDKNVKPEFVNMLKEILKGFNVLIVGNDEKVIDESDYFVDFRKKLSLGEIAWVLKNALFFIGKDSGIAHLCAVAGASGIVYDYGDRRWMPVGPGQMECFIKKDFDKFIYSLKERIQNAKSRI